MKVRLPVAVATSALIVAGAASASAPQRKNVDFASAPLGPASAFAGVSRAHTNGQQIVLAGRSRRVAVIQWNGDRPLLVAPTTTGGFCESFTGTYGGTGCFASNKRERNRLDPGLTGDDSGPIVLNGKFFDPRGTRLELHYQDSQSTVVPIIWVTSPINAGFFVFRIPSVHRRPGHRPLTISLFSASGTQLTRTQVGQP
jgi:hypothetical protein